MMKNKGVIVTIGVVFLLSSVPFTIAQPWTEIEVMFDSESGPLQYLVFTRAMRVDGILIRDGMIINPELNFVNRTIPLADDGGSIFWYDFAWSAFFEANDTNKDGAFTPGVDQHVGAIVPLSNRWESWNYSDFLYEKQDEVGYLQVSPDSNLSELSEAAQGLTALHVNYTANMTVTHQHDFLVRNVVGWSGVPGHNRSMDIEIRIGIHFNSIPSHQFKLDYQISGWDWTYDDSILVFILSPRVRVHRYLDPELDSVRNFIAVKHVGNRFSFGEGWMEYAQNASTGNTTHQVQVNASQAVIDLDVLGPFVGYDKPAIFTAFENFGNETLYHDINLGIDSVELPMIPTTPTTPTTPATPTTPTTPEISYNELLLTASIISSVTMVIIVYRDGKKKFNDKAQKPSA
ncbi:MAG: hypothetical protein ACXACG_02305 [Candidatus Thorarchaeota archaeon]|jgi:hypothetical protein